MSTPLADARRLVVKIGSALLVDQETGRMRRAWLDALADDLARCRAEGREVVVVSSGAIAVGRGHLGLRGRALKLEGTQPAPPPARTRLPTPHKETPPPPHTPPTTP